MLYLRKRGFTENTIRPAGITIPWFRDRFIAVDIRREISDPENRYHLLRGSKNGVYLVDTIDPTARLPVIIVEGEFDAISINQSAGKLVTAVATGSTKRGRIPQHVAKFKKHPSVLLGFDADDAGQDAIPWWKKAVPHAKIWQPPDGQDWNSLLVAGELRGWIGEKLV